MAAKPIRPTAIRGMIITTPERAKDFSKDPSIRIRYEAFGQGRVDIEYMPEAPIKATQRVLDLAGLKITDIAAIKSHNPFAVNDIAFSRATGVDVMERQQLRQLADLGPPAGPTRHPRHHRTDRGAGHPRRRPRPVPGLRRRRQLDGGDHRGERGVSP